MDERDEVILCDGKYRFYIENGYLLCDRYGDPWRDFIGDNAVLALFQRCREMIEKEEARCSPQGPS